MPRIRALINLFLVHEIPRQRDRFLFAPVHLEVSTPRMNVPDDVRKCIVFLGYKLHDGRMKMAGSAFLIGRPLAVQGHSVVYLVTAKHVIEGVRNKGFEEVYIRINLEGGNSEWLPSLVTGWVLHPDNSVDVAVIPISMASSVDHRWLDENGFVSDTVIQKHNIGIGDEVFITGLFRYHHGNHRNILVVRVGNIAAMPEEKVHTTSMGPMEAYLIEARSTGGLSGSPVFVHLGHARYINGEWNFSRKPQFCLLGLVHGHFDAPATKADDSMEDKASDKNDLERINVGIGIVIPAPKIQETLQQPLILQWQQNLEEHIRTKEKIINEQPPST